MGVENLGSDAADDREEATKLDVRAIGTLRTDVRCLRDDADGDANQSGQDDDPIGATKNENFDQTIDPRKEFRIVHR